MNLSQLTDTATTGVGPAMDTAGTCSTSSLAAEKISAANYVHCL